jgi:hypothetical protein
MPAGDAPMSGGGAKRAWSDRVKAMKERAEKAKNAVKKL